MKKHYGTWSLVFGVLSVLTLVFPVLAIPAVIFAVLYKKDGDPSHERQHKFARAGAVMGTVMLSLYTWSLVYVLLNEYGLAASVLSIVAAVAVIILCAWLYWRKWNKKEPVKTPAPAASADPNRIILWKESPTRGDLHLYLVELFWLDGRWQLRWGVSGEWYKAEHDMDLPEAFLKEPTQEKLEEIIRKENSNVGEVKIPDLQIPNDLRARLASRTAKPTKKYPPNQIYLLDRGPSHGAEELTTVWLAYQEDKWKLWYTVTWHGGSSHADGTGGEIDLSEDVVSNLSESNILALLHEHNPNLSLEAVVVPDDLKAQMERIQKQKPEQAEQPKPLPKTKTYPVGKVIPDVPRKTNVYVPEKAPKQTETPVQDSQDSAEVLVIEKLCQPAHVGEVEHGLKLVHDSMGWKIVHEWNFAKPGSSTQYSAREYRLPEDFFKTGSADKLSSFIASNTDGYWYRNKDIGDYVDAEKIEALFGNQFGPSEQLPVCTSDRFVSIRKEDFEPSNRYLHQLFEVAMESWVYVEYVALDIRNGKPYSCRDEVRHVGGAYGGELFTWEITYDQVREMAASVKNAGNYAGLNENTWRSFIPQDKLDRCGEPDGKPAELKAGKPKGSPMTEYYVEKHNVHYHDIVYLRKTCQGYRLFYIHSLGWHYGLLFEFNKTEKMIDEIMNHKYGHEFDAYDRLLTPREADAVLALAQKKVPDDKPTAVYGREEQYYMQGARKTRCPATIKWDRFRNTLEQIAEYGCIVQE